MTLFLPSENLEVESQSFIGWRRVMHLITRFLGANNKYDVSMNYYIIINCFYALPVLNCKVNDQWNYEIFWNVFKIRRSEFSAILFSIFSVKNRTETMMKLSHHPIINQNLLSLYAVYMTKPNILKYLCNLSIYEVGNGWNLLLSQTRGSSSYIDGCRFFQLLSPRKEPVSGRMADLLNCFSSWFKPLDIHP